MSYETRGENPEIEVDVLLEKVMGQRPMHYQGRGLTARYWGRKAEFGLDDGRELTVYEQKRERTRIGKFLLGPFVSKHFIGLDIVEPESNDYDRGFMQLRMTDAHPEPRVVTGLRPLIESPSFQGFEELSNPSVEQLEQFKDAIIEVAEK